ncbi:MAG: hypothetical protein OXH04_21915 [Acidobacteria bacterium]|nr:hypothetical protein [Acidobacteriota bacterium]
MSIKPRKERLVECDLYGFHTRIMPHAACWPRTTAATVRVLPPGKVLHPAGSILSPCRATIAYTVVNRGALRMRFISVRELRGRSATVWKTLADEKDLVVTSNGKPIAVLSATSEEHVEESLRTVRRARAQAAVDAVQQASVQAGTHRMSLDEINREIDAARRTRRG